MRLPIFQLCYSLDLQGKLGVIFPTEIETNIQQSILFAVPILQLYAPFYGLPGYLTEHKFYFPMIVRETYFELEGNINFPFIVFTIPEIDIEVTFEFAFPPMYPPPNLLKNDLYLYHIGKDVTFQNIAFIPILPISILAMNNLYTQYKIAFVGYTPNFGEINFQYFQR